MVSVSEIFGIEKSIGMYVKIGQWYAFNFCWKMLFCLYSCNDFSGEKTHCSRSLRLLCESHSSVRAVAPRLIAGAQSAWNRSELQWRYECMVSISIFSCIRASVWSFLLIATWYDVAVLVDVGVKITVDTVQVELRLPTTELNTFEFLSLSKSKPQLHLKLKLVCSHLRPQVVMFVVRSTSFPTLKQIQLRNWMENLKSSNHHFCFFLLFDTADIKFERNILVKFNFRI